MYRLRGVGGEYSGKEAVCKMGGCACDPNVYVDWDMRVCTGFGEIGEQMCRFGGVCSGEGPVCRSGACAQDRRLCARLWRDVC